MAITPSKNLVPEGWTLHSRSETFSGRAGPYYFRGEGVTPGVGFIAEKHHANMAGIVHGGALLTLADMSLWDICRRQIGLFKAVTVTLNSEFVGPGPIGSFIHSTGEMTKAGGNLVFARGIISADGKNLMAFSGILKKLK